MLLAAYSVLLGLGLVAGAPWWLLRLATTARYREGLRERLGRVPPALRASVQGRRVIWVHAVSVGEVLAVTRLVAELEIALAHEVAVLSTEDLSGKTLSTSGLSAQSLPTKDAWRIVVSTTTRTGQALARKRFGSDRVFYFPFDFRWAVRAYLHALRPTLVLLAESELWPRLLHECRRKQIPVAVVNARVSDRSFRRARRVRRLWRAVLMNVTRFLAQSETDAERLRSLGAAPEAVINVGNLKYDARDPQPSPLVESIRSACTGRPILVAGSTVEGEDELILSAFGEIRQAVPDTVLILAPRHPERFKAVAALAGDFGVIRASSLLEDLRTAPEQPPPGAAELAVSEGDMSGDESGVSVLVLDTIGDLAAVYGLANVVFVGGTLVPRGGHNPLEAARFGVPVVMGPSFNNFRDVVTAMKAADGLLIVKDEEELTSVLIDLLTNSERAHSLGERGQTVFKREGGATVRSIQTLMPLLATSDLCDLIQRREPRATAASREASA